VIIRLKDWLRRVKETSWHFRLVKITGISVPKKACAYYWICVPQAMVLIAIMFVVVYVLSAIAWFGGFSSNFNGSEGSAPFFPYKTKKNGMKKQFAPWEVVVGILLFLGIVRVSIFVMDNEMAIVFYGLWVASVGVVLAALFVAVRALAPRIVGIEMWIRNLPRRMGKFWGKVCPDLIVEK